MYRCCAAADSRARVKPSCSHIYRLPTVARDGLPNLKPVSLSVTLPLKTMTNSRYVKYGAPHAALPRSVLLPRVKWSLALCTVLSRDGSSVLIWCVLWILYYVACSCVCFACSCYQIYCFGVIQAFGNLVAILRLTVYANFVWCCNFISGYGISTRCTII